MTTSIKTCRECGETKPLSDYYKHTQMADGHLNKCKTCVKARVKTHRYDNLDRIRSYDRNRPNKEVRVQLCKERRIAKKQEDPEKFNSIERERTRKFRQANRDKYDAHRAVANALKHGKLIKPNKCSKCPATENIQGHHWSYLEEHWLDVEWLCVKCHAEEHTRLNKLKRKQKSNRFNKEEI